jgi:hypothetical protein
MNPTRLIALVLLTAGIAVLAYGGFSYTRNTQQAKLGPLELSVRETERVNIPVWAGLGAVVAGLGLLTLRRIGRERAGVAAIGADGRFLPAPLRSIRNTVARGAAGQAR